VNLDTGRFALVEPVGIVRPVRVPRAFRVAGDVFRVASAAPAADPFLCRYRRDGAWTDYVSVSPRLSSRLPLIPPPHVGHPMEVRFPSAGPGQRPADLLRALTISTGKTGALTLSRNAAGEARLFLDWGGLAHDSIADRPRATLIAGRIAVNAPSCEVRAALVTPVDEKGGIRPSGLPTALKLVSRGARYEASIAGERRRLEVAVHHGQVEIHTSDGRVVAQLKAGESRRIGGDPETGGG
jgi:hypothetical protein